MLYSDISDLENYLDIYELIVRKKSIILALFPDLLIQQSLLSEKTGIRMSNLSKDLKQLKEHGLIEIVTDHTPTGHSANFVKLTNRLIQTLESSSRILVKEEKKALTDKTTYKLFLEGLLDKKTCKPAANALQIYSIKNVIPFDTGFFKFLEENWENEALQLRLLVLIKTSNNMVQDMNDLDKENVLKFLETRLDGLLKGKISIGLREETTKLQKSLDVYNISYCKLKKKYLKYFEEEKDPSIYRSIIHREHKEKMMDLWLALMTQRASAPMSKKSKYDTEFSILQSLV
jgi:DNA-binding MarR family transcriptional regulator